MDTTFNGTGMVNTAFSYSFQQVGGLGLESVNGVTKSVAGGDVNGLNGYSPALARYNLDGSLDTSFGNDGQVVSNLG